MTKTSFATLIRSAGKILSVSWRAVYEEKKEELTRMFEEHGDRAYGVWIQQFMTPVLEHLAAEGYILKSGFNRKDSVENWGPPEERERCIWYIVKSGDGIPLGTMVLQVYHSHKTFHLPRAPRLFALEVTETEQIVSALSNAATRIRWDVKEERLPHPDASPARGVHWEYATDIAIADCLHGHMYSWTLDDSLSHWGRYGWELVSVVPKDGHVIAFFKRPCPA